MIIYRKCLKIIMTLTRVTINNAAVAMPLCCCAPHTDPRRAVVRRQRRRRRGPQAVRAAAGRGGQHAAVRGPVLGGAGPDHRVRRHRREGLQDGPAAVHRPGHDSHRRVLLRGPHYAVLLPARVLLQTAPAQGPGRRRRRLRQDGRVLQVHAVPQPPVERRCVGDGGGRTAHGRCRRGRRSRAHDGAQTGAETRVHGGRSAASRPRSTGESAVRLPGLKSSKRPLGTAFPYGINYSPNRGGGQNDTHCDQGGLFSY